MQTFANSDYSGDWLITITGHYDLEKILRASRKPYGQTQCDGDTYRFPALEFPNPSLRLALNDHA